jgi:hypothetical protein
MVRNYSQRKRKLDVQNGFPCKKLLPEKKSDVASMPTENSARVPGAAGGTGETTFFQETTKKDFDPKAIRYCKKWFFHSSPVDLRRRSRYSSSTTKKIMTGTNWFIGPCYTLNCLNDS